MEEDSSFSSMNTIHGSEFPVSLRIIKMKQKLVSNSTETIPSSLDSSIIKSISSVLLMIEELLKYKGNSTEDPIIVSREMSDSFVLLFKKVFFNSPNLYLEVMDLITALIVFSAEKYSPKKLIDYENGDLSDFERTRIIYESLVFNDPENSLILSNYAQFLYQIANDYNKAEELFKRAVQVKPVDGDALSKYGIFLWEKRGDMDAAEEAFLAAIDAEPQNSYHESKYAWFLWETGGSDICFPLKPSV
ncbi:Tetratricopeptide repeat (TPR)-like superfamily protein [Thalictrum thalictroides]|uniref:Tetratricopeptide repeat (TPR)-like superfamily protein n=1 Tax=Thalictrum thalictroides TaxID=46969 RepID=A0A7J6X515_THATH|nr:Tetratricopeptide repeat (TPR)-like superfamily protein [Thalictrum thalictroides]